ncbi:GNAT family N-acetyltransferase [Planctomicrobium sp.]|jgi:hypothetical protein|nr:GNAT family N-acetyltransferase [Planctomicrobium sp.]MDA7503761.1 GNAT family N-acetyltransferase [bacterium]MDB4733297.1 GNAT family N-acetyltransferase [Planctomicrobium sp.]
MGNPIKTVLKITKSYGLKASGVYLLNKLGRVTCDVVVEHLVTLPVNQISDSGPLLDGFEARWMTPEEVCEFSQDPSNDLTLEFAEGVKSNNRCFGIMSQGRLAAYGWYTLHQVKPEYFFQTGMQLPQNLVYMHKGFTHPDFRGQRLHAKGMQLALKSLNEEGVEAIISTVDWTNFASLKSCDRLGYQRLGRLMKCTLLGRTFSRFPPAAVQIGISQGSQLPSLVPA